MNNEAKLNAVLAGLNTQREEYEQAECDFFNKAAPELKEEYFQAWCEANHPDSAPRFIREYAETRKQTDS